MLLSKAKRNYSVFWKGSLAATIKDLSVPGSKPRPASPSSIRYGPQAGACHHEGFTDIRREMYEKCTSLPAAVAAELVKPLSMWLWDVKRLQSPNLQDIAQPWLLLCHSILVFNPFIPIHLESPNSYDILLGPGSCSISHSILGMNIS